MLGAPLRERLFALLMLASGFCGISYEVLYARVFGNVVGDQFLVSATVLLVFLFGIGIGTLFAHRLWRFLWAVEASIGLWAVVFTFGIGPIDAGLYALGAPPSAVLTVCIVALAAPAFLIGCSVPLFAGYAARLSSRRRFARVYALYNVGAGLTALVIEFALLRAFGLRGAVIAVASLNLAVAACLRLGFRELAEARPSPTERHVFARRDLAAIALASVASAIFQLTMVRIGECLFGPFRETFALILCLVLFGIAAGAWLVERFALSLARVLALAIASLALLVFALDRIATAYAAVAPLASQSSVATTGLKLAALALSMGGPAVFFGATIPALLREQHHVARESGELLFVSSVANAIGFLLMAAVLHRVLDYGALLVTVALLVAASLVVHRAASKPALGAALFLVGALVCGWRLRWDERLLYLGYTSFQSPDDLAHARADAGETRAFRGAQDVFSITWSRGKARFFINGYISVPLEAPSEKLVGAFSSVFAPRRDRALVLGVGSGATAATVSFLFDDVTAVEINPLVLEHLDAMRAYNFGFDRMPNAHIVHDDAIHYAKSSRERFSLIVNTVTSPLYFSSAKLYTTDFLEVMRARLEPDGVYVTWFDSRVGDRGADMILATAARVFSSCAVGAIKSTYYLLVCSPAAVRVRDADVAFRSPELSSYFRAHGIVPERIAYGLLVPDAFALEGKGAVENTMNAPVLEFEVARLRKRGIAEFKQRVAAALDRGELERALAPAMGFDPADGARYLEDLVGRRDVVAQRYRRLASAQASNDR